MPKISIIVPVYNTEKYLHHCIDSILAQTFTDIELLLIDDGSTDKSGKICDEYAEKDSRVRVYHKENGGVSSARNLGLDKAVGEYIGWVDSDDCIEQEMFEQLVGALKNENCDIAYCDFCSFSQTYCMPHYNQKEQFLTDYFRIPVNSLCCTLIRHQLYLANHIRFDDNNNYGEDLLVTSQLYYFSKGCVHVPDVLYHYTENPNSISHTENYGKKLELISNLQLLADFFTGTELGESMLPIIACRILSVKKIFLYQLKEITTWYTTSTWTHKYIMKNKYHGVKGKLTEYIVDKLYRLILKTISIPV